MTQVLPAIIPHTKEQLEEEIGKVSSFAKLVQLDISDGVFTPHKTWPYNGRDAEYFERLKNEEEGLPKWDDVDYEVHLMIENPEETLGEWISAGASSVVAHIESTDNFQKVIDICREGGVGVGVAIKPSTDILKIEPFVSQVDFIQVMGSDLLGKHGVPLDEKALEKIKTLREKYPDSIIGIDIGVTEDSARELVSAGANKLISGSAILDAEDREETFHYFEQLNG